MTAQNPILEFVGIEKSFFGVPVLRNLSFSLPAGRALGLVGENGAGKSTLMNIVGGNLAPDTGHMRLAGERYSPRSPIEAAAHGVAFIHQELNLFTNLSIAENLFITNFPKRRLPGLFSIDRQHARVQTSEWLHRVGLDLSPDLPVERLSPGERQLVEIAKALSIEAQIIIFDEPTTSLTAREAEHLFRLIEQLRQQGVSLIYISHALSDVMRLCDDIVVLRDGQVVGSGRRADFTLDGMISLMVGRNINQLYPARSTPPSSQKALEVKGVSQDGVVENISFDLHRGEVLGIAGLMGSGRSELARILFGLDPHQRGQVLLHGTPIRRPRPRTFIRHGMAFLTENRREEGLCLEASIADNIALVALPKLTRSWFRFINPSLLARTVADISQAVRLAGSAGDEQAVKTLSGGNQQKVVVAKWLLRQPTVLIFDEPTRGIDVGAKVEIYQLIADLAGNGAGLLIISSEIEELIGLCDRILVMANGEIKDCMERNDFDRERILRAALAGARTLMPSPSFEVHDGRAD